MSALCQAYWYPLYAFVRRQGHSAADAQDLTQEFFARLLRSHYVAAADPKRGRFRSFLLASLKHFLAHEWEKARALKRGGGYEFVPLEADLGESRYCLEPADPLTPDKLFERRWALTVLERVLQRLQQDYEAGGQETLFEALRPALTGESALPPYGELSCRLDMNEGAIRVAVHRLRRRYGELLREEIAQTVGSPDEVETELQHLLAALSP
jgi:RNA polymerase sigma-70 factor (ECF subfamily)